MTQETNEIHERRGDGSDSSAVVMRWSNDKPTKPGWYFMRTDSICTTKHVVYVSDSVFDIYSIYGVPDAEWAGPIPEPSEE